MPRVSTPRTPTTTRPVGRPNNNTGGAVAQPVDPLPSYFSGGQGYLSDFFGDSEFNFNDFVSALEGTGQWEGFANHGDAFQAEQRLLGKSELEGDFWAGMPSGVSLDNLQSGQFDDDFSNFILHGRVPTHYGVPQGSGGGGHDGQNRRTGRVPSRGEPRLDSGNPYNPGERGSDFGGQRSSTKDLAALLAGTIDTGDRATDQAVTDALERLEGLNTFMDDWQGDFNTMLDEYLPQNPYSNELLEANRTSAYDQILSEIGQLQGGLGDSLSNRGIQGGGQTSAGGAIIQAGGIGARAATLTDLLNQQHQSNTTRDLQRTGFKAPADTLLAQMRGNTAGAMATLERGNLPNTQAAIDAINGIADADFGMDKFDETMALVRENASAMNDPNVLDILFGGASQAAQGEGNLGQATFWNMIRQLTAGNQDFNFSNLGGLFN